MERAVAVEIRRPDIVLPLDQLHVALAQEHLLHAVYIVDVAAHHADARDVVDVFLGGLHRDLAALALQLLDDALGRLQAAFHMMDGIVGILHAELLVEDLQPRLDLPHGGVVKVLELQKVLIAAVKLGRFVLQNDIGADGG